MGVFFVEEHWRIAGVQTRIKLRQQFQGRNPYMTKHKSSKTELPVIYSTNSLICEKDNENSSFILPSDYDRRQSGALYDWNDWKQKSLTVATGASKIMERESDLECDKARLVTEGRLNRMMICADYLIFALGEQIHGGEKRLIGTNFCRDRFCPHCQKRRSLVLFGQHKPVVEKWTEDVENTRAKPAFILLTLTTPNCRGDDLGDCITQMLKGFKRLFELKELGFVKGFLRTLEITYNPKRDDYNPHIHVMMGVHESYFSHGYLSQRRWLALWKKSVRRDDVQIVDARRIHGNGQGVGDTHSSAMAGVLETAKYCTKPSDYMKFDEKTGKYSVNDKVLEVLMRNLKGRKLVALGGAFREIHKNLKMQDEESSDLISADLDQDNKFVALYEALWRWSSNSNGYYLSRTTPADPPIDPGDFTKSQRDP